MYDKATEKLTNEMTTNTNHPYVQVVGQYLLEHLKMKPEHAEKILSEDKTVLKSLDTMRRFAERKRVGNMAMLTDEEGFAVVLQYYGCWEGAPIDLPPEPERSIATSTSAGRSLSQNANPVSSDKAIRTNKTTKPDLPLQVSLFDIAPEAFN